MESKVHELEKIKFGVIPITVYRGCLVTKLVGGFEIFGQKVSKPEQVDEIIDKAGISLNDSIVVVNNGDIASINSLDTDFIEDNGLGNGNVPCEGI